MTVRRLLEIVEEFREAGLIDLDDEVGMQFGRSEWVPLKSVSADSEEGALILCNLEEY